MDDRHRSVLNSLALCIERGKERRNSPYPKDMLDQDGAWELCREALENGLSPQLILQEALIVGMRNIGEKFARGSAFIPELLIAAKAMNAAMEHLKPFFNSGAVCHKGKVILGTVAGDLHDIGKNIVKLVLEGAGWEVVDLGVNTAPAKFVEALGEHSLSIVGISALLTTTMTNMKNTVKVINESFPGTQVYIGGAPVTLAYAELIGASGYFPDPHSFAGPIEGKKREKGKPA